MIKYVNEQEYQFPDYSGISGHCLNKDFTKWEPLFGWYTDHIREHFR